MHVTRADHASLNRFDATVHQRPRISRLDHLQKVAVYSRIALASFFPFLFFSHTLDTRFFKYLRVLWYNLLIFLVYLQYKYLSSTNKIIFQIWARLSFFVRYNVLVTPLTRIWLEELSSIIIALRVRWTHYIIGSELVEEAKNLYQIKRK